MHPGIPCLQQNEGRLWHKTTPLLRVEEHDHEQKARNNEPVDIEEVPRTGDADRVPIARRRNDRRDVAGIVLCGPDSIRGNANRCQTNPLAIWSAVRVEVQTRVITTQKLLGPAQRGPHDCLFWFFHSSLLKKGRRLECSSSPR